MINEIYTLILANNFIECNFEVKLVNSCLYNLYIHIVCVKFVNQVNYFADLNLFMF